MVFIDESGTTSERERNITLASVWCAPTTKEGHLSILKYTADMVKGEIKQLTNKRPNEIHFASGLKRYSDHLFDTAVECSSQDVSVHKKELLWPGRPIAFRTVALSPMIESALPGYDGRLFHKNLRARGIIISLMPLLMYAGDSKIEASIVLDAEIWGDALSVCEQCLMGALDSAPVALAFSCESSRRVPGLQIADLAAGVARHHLMDGSCTEAFRLLSSGTIHRLEQA
jgi:hypothetical protein